MCIIGIISCNHVEEETTGNSKYIGKPQIEFSELSHDFGTLTEGEIVECTFHFKNTGSSPLIIKELVPDCGCTVPEYEKTEILPGKENKIKIVFNSEGFRNNIYKTIDVETNTEPAYTELSITAFIINNKSLN